MPVNPEVFDQALEKVDSPSFSFPSFHSLFSTLYALPFHLFFIPVPVRKQDQQLTKVLPSRYDEQKRNKSAIVLISSSSLVVPAIQVLMAIILANTAINKPLSYWHSIQLPELDTLSSPLFSISGFQNYNHPLSIPGSIMIISQVPSYHFLSEIIYILL